jgi:hypothetical protein
MEELRVVSESPPPGRRIPTLSLPQGIYREVASDP